VRVLVAHGPSLSHLGRREPHIYGHETLGALDGRLVLSGRELGLEVICRQTNHEGQLVDWILFAADGGSPGGDLDGIIINAGAYAHTSLAIADAIRSVAPLPVIEVHLSNTSAREERRQVAVVGAACRGRIEGFGGESYVLALRALAGLLGAGGAGTAREGVDPQPRPP